MLAAPLLDAPHLGGADSKSAGHLGGGHTVIAGRQNALAQRLGVRSGHPRLLKKWAAKVHGPSEPIGALAHSLTDT